MTGTLRRWLVRGGLLAASGGLLWLTLRTVVWGEVWATLRRLGLAQLAALAVANGVVLATFSLRWWLLLYAQGYALPYPRLILYRLITFAVSYFTPGPHFGGEPLQVYLVAKRHDVPTPVATAAVVLDKVLELLVNFLFLAGGVLLILQRQLLPGWLATQVLLAGTLLLLIPGLLLIALARGRHPLSGLLCRFEIAWHRLTGRPRAVLWTETSVYQTIYASETQSSVLCREQPRVLLLALAASLLSWLGIIGEFWLMTAVLGLELSPGGAITALVAARVAILLPLPAGLGALEASQALAMRSLGLTAAAGVSMSLLIRTRDVLLGLLGLWLGGVTLWRRRE
jgi:uncharacterized protein (TIRG00374 family)